MRFIHGDTVKYSDDFIESIAKKPGYGSVADMESRRRGVISHFEPYSNTKVHIKWNGESRASPLIYETKDLVLVKKGEEHEYLSKYPSRLKEYDEMRKKVIKDHEREVKRKKKVKESGPGSLQKEAKKALNGVSKTFKKMFS